MKRVLVVDDERPVVDAVELMVRRGLSDEFQIVGDASSGRDAVEKAMALSPDIVLMDVLMPGVSGLDAVREIRARGLPCVFIMVTAYERFDIAREAMELGVLDYLLKPVSRDKLASALRAAAGFVDRRFELERREMAHREHEERLRSFVEEAFLRALMTDGRAHFDAGRYTEALGICETRAIVAAFTFLPLPGAPDPESEKRAMYERLRSTVRYKTRALAGPFVAGFMVAVLTLPDSGDDWKKIQAFRAVVEREHGEELSRDSLRVGYSAAVPLAEATSAWSGALMEALSRRSPVGDGEDGGIAGGGWENVHAFVAALVSGDTGRARVALDRALESLPGEAVPLPDRYGIIAMFAEAYRDFERRGFLSPGDAREAMNLDDIRTAEGSAGLALASRSRLDALAAVSLRAPRWSAPLAQAIAFVRGNYGKQISLESTASATMLSPNRLSRLFVEETGRGFSDFLNEVRMERARELLCEPGASIKQVSVECGYPDPNYFSRLFKKATGMTPTAFSSGPMEEPDAEP
ncbi:MAG: hypothetical protein CVV47_06485 [Spirochaetae bacterium HGW-Spirochaetae-3]|jgi:two-component system response regulator YesN|nr:MAG: hypothetical protein CVV47_06485 [Spirochaetae bacterium HGW-Spirochaetae-3]